MSLIDISPYKFRKLTGQKEWVHVVCKYIVILTQTVDQYYSPVYLKKKFYPGRHPYQTPTEAYTVMITQTQAKHMLTQLKT